MDTAQSIAPTAETFVDNELVASTIHSIDKLKAIISQRGCSVIGLKEGIGPGSSPIGHRADKVAQEATSACAAVQLSAQMTTRVGQAEQNIPAPQLTSINHTGPPTSCVTNGRGDVCSDFASASASKDANSFQSNSIARSNKPELSLPAGKDRDFLCIGTEDNEYLSCVVEQIPCLITVDNEPYRTPMHYIYGALFTKFKAPTVCSQLRSVKSAAAVVQLSKSILACCTSVKGLSKECLTPMSDWLPQEGIRLLEQVLVESFSKNEKMLKTLLDTGDSLLIETGFLDSFWSAGMSLAGFHRYIIQRSLKCKPLTQLFSDSPRGILGQNQYGLLLTRVRSFLRSPLRLQSPLTPSIADHSVRPMPEVDISRARQNSLGPDSRAASSQERSDAADGHLLRSKQAPKRCAGQLIAAIENGDGVGRDIDGRKLSHGASASEQDDAECNVLCLRKSSGFISAAAMQTQGFTFDNRRYSNPFSLYYCQMFHAIGFTKIAEMFAAISDPVLIISTAAQAVSKQEDGRSLDQAVLKQLVTWEETIGKQTMRTGIREMVLQNSDLLDPLIATKPNLLLQLDLKDNYWGCTPFLATTIKKYVRTTSITPHDAFAVIAISMPFLGQNRYGILLGNVRDSLINLAPPGLISATNNGYSLGEDNSTNASEESDPTHHPSQLTDVTNCSTTINMSALHTDLFSPIDCLTGACLIGSLASKNHGKSHESDKTDLPAPPLPKRKPERCSKRYGKLAKQQ